MKTSTSLWLCLVVCITLTSCARTLSEEEYLVRYTEILREYERLIQALEERELPDLPRTRAERAEVLAQDAHSAAETLLPLLEEARKVRPPAKYARLHYYLIEVLESQAYSMRDYADAMRTGDRDILRAADERHDRWMREAFHRFSQEVQRVVPNSSPARNGER